MIKKGIRIIIVISALNLLLTGCNSCGKHTGTNNSPEMPGFMEDLDNSDLPDSLENPDFSENPDNEAAIPMAADELFDDFIFNYLSNRRLQLERTDFPLPITSEFSLSDTTIDNTQPASISRKDWQTERLFIDDGEYTLIFDSQEQMELSKDTTINDVAVEKFENDSDGIVLRYLFSRFEGKWRLRGLHRQPMKQNINASFIDFYHRFATDSTFQRESLSRSIMFTTTSPDNDFEQTEGTITPEFWDAFAPEMPEEIQYNIVYRQPLVTTSDRFLVVRGVSNGDELCLSFRRHGYRWLLTGISE